MAGRTFAVVSLAGPARTAWPWRGEAPDGGALRDREEQRAVLSVQPTALATQSAYRLWGRRKVGRKGPLAGVTPPYRDIHVREPGVPRR